MIPCSFALQVTGSSQCPQVQAASQSAGHTLEVNSGKLLVLVRRLYACSQLLVYKRSFHSGTRLCSGHPLVIPMIFIPAWQNGTPQFIQRAACTLCFSFERGVWNSLKFLIRSFGATAAAFSLSYSINPVGFPILRPLLNFLYSHKMLQSVPVRKTILFLPSEQLPLTYGYNRMELLS